MFIGVGQQMGNVGLTESMKRLALAPAPTVNTVRKMITPGHDLVVDIASETLVPTVQVRACLGSLGVGLPAADAGCFVVVAAGHQRDADVRD